MMPQAIPTQSFSARCAARAAASGSQSRPLKSAKLRAAASSSAEDEASPAPWGVRGHGALPADQVIDTERPRDTPHIFGPGRQRVVAAQLERCVGIAGRHQSDPPIGSGTNRQPGRPVHRYRKDEAVVVVGVIADEVHAARCAHKMRRRRTEARREEV